MNYEQLDKKAIISWRIGRIISFLVFLIVLAGVLTFTKDTSLVTQYHKIFIGIAVLLTIYGAAGIYIYPEIEYRQWGYQITDDKVEFRHGIFFVTTTVIPIVRIQHITISNGPIYRKLGLSKVKIFLASGSFEIEGLSMATADTISENLKTKVMKRLQRANADISPEQL